MEKFIEKKSAENQGIPENPSHEDIKPRQVSLNSCSEPSQQLLDVKQVNRLKAEVSVGSHELDSSEESYFNVSRFDSVTEDKRSMHYSLIDADTSE